MLVLSRYRNDQQDVPLSKVLKFKVGIIQIVERVCKTRDEEEEEENTITFRLKCIVIA